MQHNAGRARSVRVMAHHAPLKVMISGAPAAGKGTQCAKIIQKARPWAACCYIAWLDGKQCRR